MEMEVLETKMTKTEIVLLFLKTKNNKTETVHLADLILEFNFEFLFD
jgi:hypothetical protein